MPRAFAAAPWGIQPSGWSDAWEAAKGSNNATVVGFGTSQLQAAINCTDCMNLGYFPLLRKNILGRSGTTWKGDSYPISYSTAWLAQLLGTLPWSMDTTPSAVQWVGPGFGYSWIATTGSPNLCKFTTPANPLGAGAPTPYPQSARCWIWDPSGASGNVQYNINGGATQTAALAGDGAFKTIVFNNLIGSAASTINFTSQPASTYFMPISMSVFPGPTGPASGPGSGIFFTWWAWSAMPLHEFGRSDKTPADRMIYWKSGSSPEFRGDLVIIDLGNDFNYYYTQNPKTINSNPTMQVYGYPPTLFHNKLQQLANAMRSGKPPPAGSGRLGNAVSLVLSLSPFPDGIYSDVTGFGGAPQNYETYLDIAYNFALDKNAASINGHLAVGGFGSALQFETSSDVHLKNDGHDFMAQQLLGLGI